MNILHLNQFCKEANNNSNKYDDIILDWAADIYVMLQWKYNFPSASISLAIPAEEMIKAYYPFHETSYNNACEKLYHKYLEEGDTE